MTSKKRAPITVVTRDARFIEVRPSDACPRVMRDGRGHAGASLCPLCGHWHYLRRNPVRRGTIRVGPGRAPTAAQWKKIWR